MGHFNGGDGVIREILFRKDLTLSVLSERRVYSPYGLQGGSSGSRGRNLLFRHNGPMISLGGKNICDVKAWVNKQRLLLLLISYLHNLFS